MYSTLVELFTDIANAIREKGGTIDKINAQNFPLAIRNLDSSITTINVLKAMLLEDDWKFKLVSSTSDTSYSSTSETELSFDDSSWNDIKIPHDWSRYNSFNSGSKATYEGGYLDGGDAWYRKTIDIDSSMSDKRVFINFDGVYMESDVYINGVKVGSNKNGYNPFYLEITDYIDFEGDNVLSVFVRNNQPSSRWYSGSGIYRPVTLVIAESSDFSLSDIVVTTPNIESELGGDITTVINATCINTSSSNLNAVITTNIIKDGVTVATNKDTIEVLTGESTFETSILINNPVLWGIGAGNLYTVKITVKIGSKEYVFNNATFGYRSAKFEEDGFYLNGIKTFLKGVCLHHDLGCLGAEINRSAVERQIDKMIEMGANAIRLTHNPSSKTFLDVCAEKGVLCIEEFFDSWTKSKKTNDFARYFSEYAEEVIKTTVLRDRNNPSIIMWSLGNEIPDTENSSYNPTVTVQNLVNWTKEYDTTRPTTMGEDSGSLSVAQSVMEYIDVIGINYNHSNFDTIRKKYPNKPIYGSETTSALSSRGVYERDNTNYQCSSFDNDKVGWGQYASTVVNFHENLEYSCGMFVWTGFDYIGEPTPFNKYPCKSSYFGIVDLAGFEKDIFYMYQSRWTENPMIHIVPMNWNYEVGSTQKVWLYSNCYRVELFLNGVSLGSKLQTNIGSKYQFEYSVSYQKGTLVANGYDEENNLVAQDVVYTSQENPTTLSLSTNLISVNKNSDDLVFIACDVVDGNGVRCPISDNSITFAVDGGTIVGTDNGNATCVEKLTSPTKKAFNGKVLCVVKHDGNIGTISVTASGNSLTSQTIQVQKGNSTVKSENVVSFIDAENPPIYKYESTVVECTGITLNETTLTFNNIGEDSTLIATVTPTNTTDNISWLSSDSSVVTVDNGIVTAVSKGNAQITASCGSYNAVCNITVEIQETDIPCVGIVLEPTTLTFNEKGTQELTVTVTPSNTTDSVSWVSENEDIAIVENGVITPVSNGTTTIIVSCGEYSASCEVTVSIEQDSEWDIEWNGDTQTLPSRLSLTSAEVTQLDDGTYGIITNASNGEVSVLDSVSSTGILEIDFSRTTKDSSKSWSYGFVVKDDDSYRIDLHNFRAGSTDDRLVRESALTTYLTNISQGKNYRLHLDLTTMKGSFTDVDSLSEITFDLAHKSNTDNANSGFYDAIGGVIVVTGIRYKK